MFFGVEQLPQDLLCFDNTARSCISVSKQREEMRSAL